LKKTDGLKNFSFVGIGRSVTIVLQAALYLILAALLEPEIYGELNVILALAATFSSISLFGFNLTLQVNRAKGNSVVSDQVITLFMITTVVATLILAFIDVLASLLCLSASFFIMTQYQLLGIKNYKKFMVNSILKSITFLIIPIGLYFVLEIPGIIIGMAISNFIASTYFFKVIKIRSFFGLKNQIVVLLNNFGAHANNTLLFMVDKLLIAYLFGFFIVGIYQLNLQIFLALGTLPITLGVYLTSEEASGKKHEKLSLIVILASVLLAVLVIILAPILVPYFFPKYTEGIFALQILVTSVIPLCISSIYGSKLIAAESTKVGYSAVVQIGSILFFIALLGELYQLEGLSYAVLFSTIINAVFLYFLYKQTTRLKKTET